jgi:YD repeat-containing protein
MRKKTLAAAIVLILVAVIAPALRGQSTGPVQYVYDDLGRLVKVVDQNGNVATYNYDAAGNLLSITLRGAPSDCRCHSPWDLRAASQDEDR